MVHVRKILFIEVLINKDFRFLSDFTMDSGKYKPTVNFKYFIYLAFDKKLSWNSLESLLEELSPTLAMSKQLNRILLKELKESKLTENTNENKVFSSFDESNDNDFSGIDFKEKLSKDSTIEIFENHQKNEDVSRNMEFSTFSDDEIDGNDQLLYKSTTEIQGKDLFFIDSEENEVAVENQENKEKSNHLNGEIELEMEANEATNSTLNQYECKICKKVFKSTSSRNLHERIHYAEKAFECKTCKKLFSHVHSFQEHERIHTGEKPYQCTKCSKKFISSRRLKLHDRTHTGEKPHECKTCFKHFRNSSDLKRHEKIHTGERPHVCKVCFKGFIEASKLKNHMKTHCKEDPFESKTLVL